jgi:RNA recognition motif-containing protein
MSVRLFVGNLTYDVTEAELRELFSAVGTLTQVRIPVDRETGKPKGIAFVDFPEKSQADEAIRRFNQQMFKGRALAVNEARAREDRPAGDRPAPRPFTPRPSIAPRPDLSGLPTAPDDDASWSGQPRRKFGPDAKQGLKKKEAFKSKEERVPKGPIKERSGGKKFLSDDDDDVSDDNVVDDFTLWALEDAKNKEEE